jgi:preprotein translocase subunit SecA
MAGRGTDIMLGGNAEALAKQELRKQGMLEDLIIKATSIDETDNEEVLKAREEFRNMYNKFSVTVKEEKEKVITAGGLKIIGTERHESRRIDNQLRGRSGRQGDIGESRFYISFEDDLMRIFGSERIQAMADALKLPEDMPIEMRMLTNTIENAQKNVEARNFATRKHVLQFDDVMNKQREIIYSQRKQVLDGADIRDNIIKMVENSITEYVDSQEEIDAEDLKAYMKNTFGIDFDMQGKKAKEKLKEELLELANKKYEEKEEEIGKDKIREIERVVMLHTVDEKWMDHIDAMDQLKQGVNLRAYGQRDPVIEFKYESYDMFNEMTNSVREDVIRTMFHIVPKENVQRVNVAKNIVAGLEGSNAPTAEKRAPIVNKTQKVGRNDPCPCGSGKKYKKCCGKDE